MTKMKKTNFSRGEIQGDLNKVFLKKYSLNLRESLMIKFHPKI